MTLKERNQQVHLHWFFNGGCEGMTKLEQAEFLVEECGYTEEGAFALVYGGIGNE